eukprot:scaffold19061_cov31-Tisochrysis_lutea.AAC.3
MCWAISISPPPDTQRSDSVTAVCGRRQQSGSAPVRRCSPRKSHTKPAGYTSGPVLARITV